LPGNFHRNRAGGEWNISKAEIINNNTNSTIEVLPQTEKGWLRIVIKTKDNQIVKWQLNFKK